MNSKHNLPIKVISIIVIFFFCWTFCICEIPNALANSKQSGKSSQQSAFSGQQSSASADQPMAGKPEEKFEKTLNELEQILTDTSTDIDTKKNKAKGKKSEFEALDVEIKKQFSDTEKKLKDEGLPNEILQRHYDFVKKYEDNLNELKSNLDNIEKAKTKAEVEAEVEKTKKFLEKVKSPKKYVPLDPNKLPHRTAEPVWIEPRTNSEEFSKDSQESAVASRQSKPILIASNGPLSGLLNSPSPETNDLQPILLAQASNPPTDADLAETIEVKFTPAIQAKAQEFGNNPVKIYNWVRNNIEFVPTYGSIQGADMCLQTKQCNDSDTASLLIALLRASGIHARYVYGTIEIPIEKVKNWVGGFTDSMEALRLLASAKIPTKGMTVGGEIKYARIEHVWVEAWIDYIPSRGARHKSGQGDTWIPLDASFKQYNYTQGLDLQSAVPFDAQTFVDQITSTATINETEGYVTNVNSLFIQQTMTDYQTQVENYISQNYPNATVGDVLGKEEIIKQEFPILAGTLPYKTIVKGATYSELPNLLRHRLTFEIYKDVYDELLGTKITITKSFPEIAGKRISLNYVPATEADKNLLDSYVQNYATSVPAYLINLKAEFKVDNTVIATGPSITMGTDQVLNLTFITPTGSEMETHLMMAGDYNVIGLNIGGTKTIFENRVAKNDFSDPVSEMLYQTILGYWTEYDTLKDIYAKVFKVATVRLPSEGLSLAPVSIKYVFGIPYNGSYSEKGLDVVRDKEAVISLDGNKTKVKRFNQNAGIIGSLFEGLVFDQLFGYEIGNGISTVRVLELANSQGIPIYYINVSNLDAVIPNLQISGDVINDIRNAVNAGKEVIVPKTNITHNGWIGTGYVVRDPNTGSGGYIIEGGTAGGIYKYEANLQAAMAIGETPYSSGIILAVDSWKQSVGSVVLSEIAADWGIEIPALEITAGAWVALTVLMLVIIIAAAIDQIIDSVTVPSTYVRFRHYTTIVNKGLILSCPLKLIISASDVGDLGPGAYVTDLFLEPDGIDGPNTDTIAKELNMPKWKIQTYIELLIDIIRRPLRNGTPEGYPHQWVYQNMSLRIDGKSVILVPTP
jgi:transglutaminase-like putative cysteine protease